MEHSRWRWWTKSISKKKLDNLSLIKKQKNFDLKRVKKIAQNNALEFLKLRDIF